MVNEMTDREQDKRVAEILGFVVVHEHWMRPIDQPDNYRAEQRLPRYTTDPAADYEVLEWVRAKHSAFQFAFRLELNKLFHSGFGDIQSERERPILGEISYIAGDYSRALLALDEQGLLK